MVFSVLASAGLPGLNGFVGEFLILLGSFKSTVLDSVALVALATTGVILAAVYLLYMVYKLFFGELTDPANANLADVNAREFVLMAPLVLLMLVMGFFPQPFLKQTAPATTFLLDTIEEKHAAVEAMEAPPTADDAAREALPVAPPEAAEVTLDPDDLRSFDPDR
jgi:NADH-quinone oxidoreductase subunit M